MLRWLWRSPHNPQAMPRLPKPTDLIAGERWGDHDVAIYLAQVNAMKREFLRIGAETSSAGGGTSLTADGFAPSARLVRVLERRARPRSWVAEEVGVARQHLSQTPLTLRRPDRFQKGPAVRIPLAPAASQLFGCGSGPHASVLDRSLKRRGR